MSVTTETKIDTRPTSIEVLKKLGRLWRVGSKLTFSYCLASRAADVRQDGETWGDWSEPDVRRHYADAADLAASDQMVAANSICEFSNKRRSRGYTTGHYTIRVEQKTKNIVGGFCTTQITLAIERVS